MKKQYIFLIMIFIILYLSYLIVSFTYKDNKKNQYIDEIIKLNTQIKEKLEIWEEMISYKWSKAYINKIRKEEQWEKTQWELVVYLTTQEKYNKFSTVAEEVNPIEKIEEKEETNILSNMNIFQKWVYFIFKKNLSL